MNEISDEDIVRMFHSGNGEEKAFRLLVGKYSERLYWHIRKIVIGHEDSDDVLQNTFIKIWKGLREFRYEAKLFTWMYRVATNEAINFLSEKRRKTYGNSQVLKLPERQRLVFNMKYFDDMKYEDIAEVLDVAVGTLKATYHNAVKKIEESLKISDTLPSFE